MSANGNGAGKGSRLTPLDNWLDDYDEVGLPSGKVVGLRSVDVLTLMSENGKIPTVLKVALDAGTGKRKEPITPTSDDNLEMAHLADKVLRAALVHPPLVETEEDEKARKGIRLMRFSMTDKMAVLTWAMGGQAAVNAANMFLVPEEPDVQPISAIDEVRLEAVDAVGD